jgi:hypothetical protein
MTRSVTTTEYTPHHAADERFKSSEPHETPAAEGFLKPRTI